jgi:hypothetical protein
MLVFAPWLKSVLIIQSETSCVLASTEFDDILACRVAGKLWSQSVLRIESPQFPGRHRADAGRPGQDSYVIFRIRVKQPCRVRPATRVSSRLFIILEPVFQLISECETRIERVA